MTFSSLNDSLDIPGQLQAAQANGVYASTRHTIYRLYRTTVENIARRHCYSFIDLDLEDLVQDGFVTLILMLNTSQGQDQRGLLCSIRREIDNALSRRRYSHARYLKVAERLFHQDSGESIYFPESQAESDERREMLEAALNQLTLKQQEVIQLFFGIGQEFPTASTVSAARKPSGAALRRREKRALKSLAQMSVIRELYVS